MDADKILTCADCGQEFVFTGREQEFYATRGFSEPRRCGSCRATRKAARGDGGGASGGYGGNGGGSGSRGPREMFAATCSGCGKDAQVPFRPTSGKPVYCSDCFALRRA